jgi:hypothetical protein
VAIRLRCYQKVAHCINTIGLCIGVTVSILFLFDHLIWMLNLFYCCVFCSSWVMLCASNEGNISLICYKWANCFGDNNLLHKIYKCLENVYCLNFTSISLVLILMLWWYKFTIEYIVFMFFNVKLISGSSWKSHLQEIYTNKIMHTTKFFVVVIVGLYFLLNGMRWRCYLAARLSAMLL